MRLFGQLLDCLVKLATDIGFIIRVKFPAQVSLPRHLGCRLGQLFGRTELPFFLIHRLLKSHDMRVFGSLVQWGKVVQQLFVLYLLRWPEPATTFVHDWMPITSS